MERQEGEDTVERKGQNSKKKKRIKGRREGKFQNKNKEEGKEVESEKKRNSSGEGEIKMKRWRNERGRGEAGICGQEWFGTHYAEVWFWPGSH